MAARTTDKPASTGQMYIAIDSGCAEIKGVPIPFVKGKTIIREGNPLLAAAGHCFTVAEDRIDYGVESATQGPGEQRGRQS